MTPLNEAMMLYSNMKAFVGGKILAILKITRDDKKTIQEILKTTGDDKNIIKEISKPLDKNEDILVEFNKKTTHSLHDCLSFLNAHFETFTTESENNFHFNCPSKEELEVPIWTFQEILAWI